MNCPSCGETMEEGFLRTHHYPTWTQQAEMPIFRAPKDLLYCKPLDDEAVSAMTADVYPEYPGACLCRRCGLAVFPCAIVDKKHLYKQPSKE